MIGDNDYMINGILYEKFMRKWVSKKGENGQTHYYIIEKPTRREIVDKDGIERNFVKTELVKMQLPWKMNPDDYDKGEELEIAFYLSGMEFTKDSEKGYITNPQITTIRRSNKQGEIKYDNKVKVSAMSDINKIGDPPEDNPFPDVVTNMVRPKTDDDDDIPNDLPF